MELLSDDVTSPILGLVTVVRDEVYRVVRTTARDWVAMRVRDDVRIGNFTYAPGLLQLTTEPRDTALLAEIAAAAIKKGLP
jgi:hypothetical protein